MSVFLLSFLSSLLITMLVIRYQRLHGWFSADSDLAGVQKFHDRPVPRIGGLGIAVAVLLAMLWRLFENASVGGFGLLLLLAAIPAFGFGFIEDVTKRVGVSVRLLATALSAALAGWLLGAWLPNLQIFGVDALMAAFPWLAILVTCFAVAGVANAFNIIDGYNGLSAMVGVIILGGIAYVAFQLADFHIMIAALGLMGALLGFLVWNYPRGLIFLGDGGAYFVGFWIAELSVLLTARHPEVSKWFPLLLCFYPIFETLFTIYRRVFVLRTHPGMPDAAHLHQIIYKRLVRWAVGSSMPQDRLIRNALTAPYLWVLTSVTVIPAVLFWRYAWVLQIFALLFAVSYVLLYRMIVKFKTPTWLTLQRQHATKSHH
jgi:UDP-N-acetylmuramyl pentapeptide phosphotransferase/UDP-N-acetylglucosamine-1-phosphate transferase